MYSLPKIGPSYYGENIIIRHNYGEKTITGHNLYEKNII